MFLCKLQIKCKGARDEEEFLVKKGRIYLVLRTRKGFMAKLGI